MFTIIYAVTCDWYSLCLSNDAMCSLYNTSDIAYIYCDQTNITYASVIHAVVKKKKTGYIIGHPIFINCKPQHLCH